MQGSKHLRAKLWIAGVSTAAILLGCESEPIKQQAANDQLSTAEEVKAKTGTDKRERQDAAQATVAPQAAPSLPYGDVAQGAVMAPASPAAEIDMSAGAAAPAEYVAPPASYVPPVNGALMGGAAWNQPIPGEGENYIATTESPVKQAAL